MRPRRWIVGSLLVLGGVAASSLELWTKHPSSCSVCHEMRYDHDTWRTSSHSGVPCQACHTDYGAVQMLRNKLRAQKTEAPGDPQQSVASGTQHRTRVPSKACLSCHPEDRLPGELRYHLLFVTHRRHLERGAECSKCHSRVVHGGKAPFKNTPTMAACLVCHNGKTAGNRCGLCHERLGEMRPPLYDPAWVSHHKENLRTTGQARCQSCHTEDFCHSCHASVRPHPAGWVREHRDVAPEDRKQCSTCHRARPGRTESDFCIECHEAKRAHGKDFLRQHAQAVRDEPDTCRRCHEQKFCSDCHSIYTPHERGWLGAHPASARSSREGCRTCHEDTYCQACHTGARPKSHTPDWPTTHGPAGSRNTPACRVCHPTDFCRECHRKSPPSAHRSPDWTRVHGGAAVAAPASCRACHDEGECTSCHRGISMPHPDGWVRAHQRADVPVNACNACHGQAFCNACHRGSKPASHDERWEREHGDAGARSRARCLRCHSGSFCDSCHRVPMPHPANVSATHPDVARGKEGRYCALCHEETECADCHAHSKPQSHRAPEWPKKHAGSQGADGRCAICHEAATCDECHGLPMPHPDAWTMGPHGAEARKAPAVCSRCHEPDECQACHQAMPPSSHAKKDFKKMHGAETAAEPLCALCHGANLDAKWDSCQTCHKGVKMPHPDDYALQHKGQASFKSDGPCLGCHQPDQCKPCHANEPALGT